MLRRSWFCSSVKEKSTLALVFVSSDARRTGKPLKAQPIVTLSLTYTVYTKQFRDLRRDDAIASFQAMTFWPVQRVRFVGRFEDVIPGVGAVWGPPAIRRKRAGARPGQSDTAS